MNEIILNRDNFEELGVYKPDRLSEGVYHMTEMGNMVILNHKDSDSSCVVRKDKLGILLAEREEPSQTDKILKEFTW